MQGVIMDELDRLVKKFEEWLKTKKGNEELNYRNNNLQFFENIKNKINEGKDLSNQEVWKIFFIDDFAKELRLFTITKRFRNVIAYEIRENPQVTKNFIRELVKQGKKGFDIKIISRKLKDLKLRIKNIAFSRISELLCLFYPENYWIISGTLLKELKEVGIWDEKIELNEKNYKKLGELLKRILDKLKNNLNISQILGRRPNFYDADMFLWYLKKEFVKDRSKNNQLESKNLQSNSNIPLLTHYFSSRGFYFDENLVKAFYSALKTKGFVILSGLSGTGKTKLAQLFAELLCLYEKCHEGNKQSKNTSCNCTYIFLSVRPDWRDGKPLLGYYNPLTEKYESTPLLSFILEAIEEYKKKREKAYFIILDEMNLSHVEYYFADFLSVLESGRDENLWTKETIKLYNFKNKLKGDDDQKIPNEIKLPPNLYIIGTVNIDETTYMFSPKVLDRAFTLEFKEVDFKNYMKIGLQKENLTKKMQEELRNELLTDLKNIKNDKARFCGAIADKEEIKEAIEMIKNNKIVNEKTIFEEIVELNQNLQPYDLHFGYRVLDEMALFIKYATEAPDVVGRLSKKEALDFAVLMKVLPKFHGPRQKLERPLRKVLTWCANKFADKGDNKLEWISDPSKDVFVEGIEELLKKYDNKKGIFKYPRTAKKVLLMLKQLYETGFASFA